jgi:hypothetical protein
VADVATKSDVVRAYCRLSAEVASHLGWQEPADCFCGDATRMESYRYSQKVFDFIAFAVSAKIQSECAAARPAGDTITNPPAPPTSNERVERLTASALAHRACCGTEHDPAHGKFHGCCIVCGVPWPCDTAKSFLVTQDETPADSGIPEVEWLAMVARDDKYASVEHCDVPIQDRRSLIAAVKRLTARPAVKTPARRDVFEDYQGCDSGLDTEPGS